MSSGTGYNNIKTLNTAIGASHKTFGFGSRIQTHLRVQIQVFIGPILTREPLATFRLILGSGSKHPQSLGVPTHLSFNSLFYSKQDGLFPMEQQHLVKGGSGAIGYS